MVTHPFATLRTKQSGSSRFRWAALLLIAALCTALRLSAASEPPPTPPPSSEAPPPAGPQDEFGRGTPRESARGFLEACQSGDFERASHYLDLRRVSKAAGRSRGATLARQLCTVLDRELWVDLEALSNAPEGESDDGLPRRNDLLGTIQTRKGSVQILLERVPREDGTLIWKVFAATVAQIPALDEEFGYGPLGDLLPAPFFEFRFLQIQLWQWIILLLLIVVAYALSWLGTSILVRIGRSLVVRTRTAVDDKVLAGAVSPLRLAIGTLVFYLGTVALALSVRANALVNGFGKVLTVAAITWLLLRLVDAVSLTVEERLMVRQHTARAFVPLGRRSIKVVLIAMAFLATLQNLGFNVTSLLAGLGIGGLAVALAAQKTVENLFGSITLFADQPVSVGDVCRFGDKVGTVEDIGLRSTRLRTPERTIISIPNAEFAGMQLENLNKRDRIRLNTTIGLRHETTPDQLRWILIQLKRLLLAHPKVHRDPARVRFIGFGASSLDVEIFAYTLTTDMNEFLAIQEDIFLRIMEIITASGSNFAMPSQIGYAGGDNLLDAGKRQAVEAQVAQWRAENQLYLPDFPTQQMAGLDALDYPPKGAPAGQR